MSRDLDTQVATTLGLDVVGVGMAYPDPEVINWWHPTSEEHNGNEMQPLYLAHCVCADHALWAQPVPKKMFGHYPGCLEVVGFYSEDIAAAMSLEPHMPYFNLRRLVHNKWWQCQSAFCGDIFNHVVDHCGCKYGDAAICAEAICLAFLAAMAK